MMSIPVWLPWLMFIPGFHVPSWGLWTGKSLLSWGSLCLGSLSGSLSGEGSSVGGSLSGEPLSGGGGGGSLSRGFCVTDTLLYIEWRSLQRAVHILLECIIVVLTNSNVHSEIFSCPKN